MEKVVMNEADFFKGYTQDEINEINVILKNMQKYIDREKLEAAAKVLNNPVALKYPELSYFLINLLINLELYKIAYRVASKMNVEKIKDRSDYKQFVLFRDNYIAFYNQMNQEKLKTEKEKKVLEEKQEVHEEVVPTETVKEEAVATEVNEEDKKTNNEDNELKELISILLAKIYADAITLEEIQTTDIPNLQKNILLTSYFERINKQKAASFIKTAKKNDDNPDHASIYNRVINMVISKRNIFNIEFYASILNTRINYELYQELVSKKIQEEHQEKANVLKNKVIVLQPTPKESKTKETPRHVEQTETKVVKQPEKKVIPRVTTPAVPAPKVPKKKGVDYRRIKDVFPEETEALLMYLYILMQYPETQKKAVIAFDNLECLSERLVTSTYDLERFEYKVKVLSLYSSYRIKYDSDKFNRQYNYNAEYQKELDEEAKIRTRK